MRILSTPATPLFERTFFHASAIHLLETMYSTDVKSTVYGSMTRLLFTLLIGGSQ